MRGGGMRGGGPTNSPSEGGGGKKKKGKKRNGFGDITITDSVRIAVSLTLENFKINEEECEYEFPSSLTNMERAYVHKMCLKFGLKSKSRGKGQTRYVTVYKLNGSSIVKKDAFFTLEKECRDIINQTVTKYPVSGKERVDLLPVSERSQSLVNKDPGACRRTTGKLASVTPKIPPSWGGKSCLQRRKDLPIWDFKSSIIQNIEMNQVVLVTGATGSGKTTQVPQFILEDAFVKQRPVRVIVCQPRRLAVTTVSERVAQERDEKLGETIGYQIRLDSVTSPNNIVTFCTYGILMRSLMGGDNFFNSVTHIIVDEVHERDKLCDFLLTILKDTVVWNSNLKLIMMSATVDAEMFSQFFPTSARVDVPGRMFPVEEFFMEDILYLIKGKTPGALTSTRKNPLLEADNSESSAAGSNDDVFVESDVLDDELDQILEESFLNCTEEKVTQMTLFLECDASKVDYKHSKKGVTILMIAAAWGHLDLIQLAISVGAKLHLTAPNGWTALEFAQKTGQTEAAELLRAQLDKIDDFHSAQVDRKLMQKLDQEKLKLLENYQNSFDDEEIDHQMIVEVVSYIHVNKPAGGAILVFLPGYDDIVQTRDFLLSDRRLKGIDVFMLHSQIMPMEFRKAFQPSKPGVRKVILSTNIAETGVTLSDVIFVIDSGKVKELSFDALTNCSQMRNDWVSKSSATQRKGRAGRVKPGEVYRMFSSLRYSHMSQFPTPEIMRTPLLDLCLQTKLLAPPNTPIADFLAKVPEPPPFVVTRNAVQYLKTIEALDQWEEVTSLGCHLLDIPLDPVYGKILLYGVLLNCLDPILTICCSLSYRDPFMITTSRAEESKPKKMKLKFAGDSHSDHKMLLNLYMEWESAKDKRAWCRRSCVSHSTMEMISGMRLQVLSNLKENGMVRGARGVNSIPPQYNANSTNWSIIKACLVAGLYPNLARYDSDYGQLRTSMESKVKIHHSSVCNMYNKKNMESAPSDWLVYTEVTRAGHSVYLKGVTFVSAAVVALMAGPAKLPAAVWEAAERSGQVSQYLEESSDSGEDECEMVESVMVNLDPWITFRMSQEDAHSLLQLRQKVTSHWLRRLTIPGGGGASGQVATRDESDRAVISSLAEVLQIEDLVLFDAKSPKLAELRRSREGRSLSAQSADQEPVPWADQSAVFFIVRPSPRSLAAVEAAKSRGKMSIWSFSPGVERKMLDVSNGKVIYIFFCVVTTSLVQGCASLTGEVVHEGCRVGQRIHWVSKQPLNLEAIASCIDLRDYEGKDLIPLTREMATEILHKMNSTAQATYDPSYKQKPHRKL